MTVQYLFDAYAQESFDNSRDHGFWDDKENRNKDEMVMLMINELSECQEAYRSSKHNTNLDFLSFEDAIKPEYHNDPSTFASWYKDNIKGCTGEELADVVIRIFDFIVGWNIGYNGGKYFYGSTKNFSADLRKLTKLVNAAGDGQSWDYSLSAIVQFADDWNIDLEYHIKNKQRYNRTRPYKHGKLF